MPTTNTARPAPNSQEEECLHRLKAQRRQIEELISKYRHTEKLLEESKAREQELLEENEELEKLGEYRDMYDALKAEFERVYAQAELDGFHAKQTQE